ncbi:MAG TPA: DUF1573 domain-containing protein [Flavobacteriales bacterium]|nr:DUF1573 domain-containing protein [Flavobacteriales bacterium]
MRFFLVLYLLLNSALANAQAAEFSFSDRNLKLAKTPEGKVIQFEYPFTNSGKSPLIITEIKVQCPCTTFEYPKDPIPPGGSGVIRVSFDTAGKIGYQYRTLIVYSNALKSPVELRFRVMVDNKKKG